MRLPEAQKYVEQLRFGLCLSVLGYYCTYFWGSGQSLGYLESGFSLCLSHGLKLLRPPEGAISFGMQEAKP